MQWLDTLSESNVTGVWRRACRMMLRSRLNYRLAYVTDFSCAAVFSLLALQSEQAGFVGFPLFFVGAFVFSFVEYALHRWMFHARSPFLSETHTAHHADPLRPAALPFLSSAVSSPIFFYALAPSIGDFLAHASLAGFFWAYFLYGLVHHLQHRIRIKDLPFRWLRTQWAAHAVHHGRDNVNFGVTTSFWDRLFGTYYPVPRR
jgi:sterol desaturase/sphingolipid hydroxylase (fatty acid hydroxylase superfamily)